MRRHRRIAALALLLLGLSPAAPSAAAAPAGAPTAPCGPVMFTDTFVRSLEARWPGRRFTAAVHDTRSGCWYHLHPGLRITTASVIKAHVLGAVLLQAQRAHRGLSDWERARIDPMIRYSFNSPWVSDLYAHVGGEAGMAELDRLVGGTSTTHTRVYGATVSTARDRTLVARALFAPGSVLGDAAQREAWRYMGDVHPTQRWGITAGVPLGWTVALKNGFYPTSGAGWRLGSTGYVQRAGTDQGYAITILTDHNTDHVSGQALVEAISRRVARRLTVGPPARRLVDRARCTTTSSTESWSQVAARLGLPASAAGDVRTVSGGNSEPLTGQRACAPTLRPEPRSAASTVHGTYLPVVSDLTCDGRDDIVWYGSGDAPDALWQGRASRRFEHRSIDVRGTYAPSAGDFDGDGCGDVLWWGPGSNADALWSGQRRGGASWKPLIVPGRGQHHVVGDVDGDGHDDLVRYRPGTGDDTIWFGTDRRGRFRYEPTSVGGAYEPVAGDLDGDGTDDLVWYGVGGLPDSVWFGRRAERGAFRSRPIDVGRRYRPVRGDFGGDGDDELLWYGPGRSFDTVWREAPPGQRPRRLDIDRDALSLVGDFDGDGRDDVALYGPGGTPDGVLWGRAEGGFVRGRLVD